MHFIPVHQLTGYARLFGQEECRQVPVTDRVAANLLSLPLYPLLRDGEQDLVIDAMTTIVRGIG